MHLAPTIRQDLRMNPRLYQAMDLLQMPLLDLQQHLKEELETNPFLELTEPEEPEVEETTPAAEAETADDSNWEDILLDGFDNGGRREEYEERDVFRPVAVDAPQLADHLRDQLKLLQQSPRQRFLSEEFIGNIAEDGYLRTTLPDVVAGANARRQEELGLEAPDAAFADAAHPLAAAFSEAEAEEMLAMMQRLEPPGVGARDLRECLLIQLRDLGLDGTLACRLVDERFEDLIGHRWTELAKAYGVSARAVQDAADELARLDPKPGLQLASSEGEYVVPDLVVEKTDGEYRVFLNDSGMPRLRISRVYRDLAADKKQFTGENREFVTQKLNSATWLIQAIEQRRQTMLRVMRFIVDRQQDFFEKGVEHLRPLTLREVAEVLGVHESTVSRVTSQKYAQTPRGVFPLKYFFSSGLNTTTGEDASSRAVKAQIEKLIAEEDAGRPLTDQQIVAALSRRGVRIARRTVAKYREQLHILPARMRKRV